MSPSMIVKYGFRIQTRGGTIVDHLLIHGKVLNRALQQIAVARHPG